MEKDTDAHWDLDVLLRESVYHHHYRLHPPILTIFLLVLFCEAESCYVTQALNSESSASVPRVLGFQV